MSPNRVSFLLFLAVISLAALWIIFSQLVVPPLIESAYRGESLPIFNRIISGQASHSIDHYVAEWNKIFRAILFVLLVVALIILVIRYVDLQRVDLFIHKYKVSLLWIILGYLIAAHYWFLGFTTFDGFSYRIPPIVELVQHGNLGGEKFDFYAAKHFWPFFELLHFPFLRLLGLPGLFFSFSLVLFPLAIAAVYGFVLEVTANQRWATYSTMVYVSIPFINEHPFSGYIDFAVIGAFAFFLFSLLRVLRSDQPSVWSWALFLAATFVFSMSRQHTPYLSVFLVGSLITWHLGPWHDPSLRPSRARLLLLLFMFALGMTPSVFLHVRKFLEFGTPIYPFQFKFFGIATASGYSLRWEQGNMWLGFVRGWLWPDESLPIFFDSRLLAVGFFFWIALITFPIICRAINGRLTFTLVLFIAISLMLRDFMTPRYSMSLVLAVVLVAGGALALCAVKGPRWAYATILVVTVLHLVGRPVYVGAGISMFDKFYYRANVSGSPWFITSSADPEETPIEIYPDWGADLLIVYPIRNGFVLPLYGKNLSNRIVGKLDPSSLGESCTALRNVAERSQHKLFIVDQTGRLAGKCAWICEMPRPWGCMAQRIRP